MKGEHIKVFLSTLVFFVPCKLPFLNFCIKRKFLCRKRVMWASLIFMEHKTRQFLVYPPPPPSEEK